MINKAKQMLLAEARKLMAKAEQKKREVDRLEKEAKEMFEQANILSD